MIVRGNKPLAQAYALHINGVYDHYSWRAYLGSGGDPDQIFKPLDGWKPGGSRAQELDFWMQEPIPAQTIARGASPTASQTTPGRRTKPKAGKAAKKTKTAKTPKAKKATRAPKSAKKTKAVKKAKPSGRAAKAKAKSKASGKAKAKSKASRRR